MKRLVLGAFALPLALGCGGETDEPVPAPAAPAVTSTPTRPPPHLELDIPEWPPVGPDSRIGATCSGENLRSISASFTYAKWTPADGSSFTTWFSGKDLGEGQGDLNVACCETIGMCSQRQVQKFLVDLTPPDVTTDRIVARPAAPGLDGEISVWVGDAWVLGSVELTFLGTTLRYDFPSAYPSTLGTEWDVSRVAFSAKDLPIGAGKATVTVRDAAGNTTVRTLDVRVDETPPTVAFVEPTPGAAVDAPFVVKVRAVDEGNPTPATIDVFVGGALVGELTGPDAELTVDPSTLPPGSTEVRAVARDDAGNESVATRVVEVVASK